MFTEEFRKYLIIGITIVLLFVIILCSKLGNKGPLKNSTFSFGVAISESLDIVNDWTKRQLNFATNIFNLKGEVEKLKEENEQLKLTLSLYEKYKNENEELKNVMNIENADYYTKKITARIVGVDPNNVYKVYIINKETKQSYLF